MFDIHYLITTNIDVSNELANNAVEKLVRLLNIIKY